MKTPLLLPIIPLLVLALSGCAHKAVHFSAPDAAPLVAVGHKLSTAVVESREAVKQASAAVTTAAKSHEAETKRLTALEPKVSDLLRVAPAELRPAVEQVQSEVVALRSEQDVTTEALGKAQLLQADATGKLEQANAAKNEVEKLSPGYLAEVDKLTARANASEIGWAKDSKALAWYRLHRLMGWLLLIGGIAASAVWALVKFTARGAAIAARF